MSNYPDDVSEGTIGAPWNARASQRQDKDLLEQEQKEATGKALLDIRMSLQDILQSLDWIEENGWVDVIPSLELACVKLEKALDDAEEEIS